MSFGEIHSPFICVDDITIIPEDMNFVIYNPNLNDVDKRECVRRVMQNRFNVTLTEEQLDEICSYDKHHLNECLEKIKSFID